MISAAYDCAAVEKKMRHLEAAIVLENVAYTDRGPLQARRQPRRLCLTRWGLATRAGWNTARTRPPFA